MDEDWSAFPRELADRCVKCAQCLPVCPTWRLTGDEAESARGRVALMLARVDGLVGADRSIVRHLDQCIQCGHCERACPADVPVVALAAAAQAATRGGRRAPWPMRLLRAAVARPRVFAVVARLLRASSWTPLRSRLMPRRATAPPAPGEYAPLGSPNGATVALFVGCVARALDGATLSAALRALRRSGYAVTVPRNQGCCGALHRHAGEHATADRLAAHNAAAFSSADTVASCASGCSGALHAALGARVVDISTLVARHAGAAPARGDTAVHVPCTLAGTPGAAAGTALLAGARVLAERGRCCGAGGEYQFRHPATAARLRDAILDEVGDADVLCTSNPGCAAHLRAGLAARGARTAVRHPVVEWLRD